MTHARPFARQDLADLLGLVATNAAARWPAPTYLMPGDVAWQFPGCAPRDNIRLWYDGQGLLGYLWYQPGGILQFDVRHDASLNALLSDMLAWAKQRRRVFEPGYPFYLDLDSMEAWAEALRNPVVHPRATNRHLIAAVLDGGAERLDALQRHGFAATAHEEVHFACDLGRPVTPVVAQGMRLRHVTDADLEERVRVHVAAWAPGSTFDRARYWRIRAMPPYDPELDIVAETATGDFASYTIAWPDPVSGVGMIEPVGPGAVTIWQADPTLARLE